MLLPATDCGRFLGRSSAVALAVTMTMVSASRLQATDVLTWHNDLARTGQNLTETVLTPANVNSTSFGKLFTISVDGQVYAQPLVVSGLNIPGKGVHDVVYIATEHDSVYACDANDGTVLWQISLLGAGERTFPGCGGLTPEYGITATPVIDRTTGPHGTIYVEAMTSPDGRNGFHRLHALDLATGAEQFGGPVNISGSYPGTGDNSDGVNVIFDPKQYKERTGLVLYGGVVYLAWGSLCGDGRPYTGWIMGYDKTTLAQVSVFDTAPNGNEGGIWSSGAAPAIDSNGNMYVMTSNGTVDTALDPNGFPSQNNYGQGMVKLSTSNNTLRVVDYWAMFDAVQQSLHDTDFGSGGPMLLPDMVDNNGTTRHLVVGAGKDTYIYILDRDNMGKFDPNSNSTLYQQGQRLPNREFGAPAYFNGMMYYGAVSSNLRAYTFTNARLNNTVASSSAAVFSYPGTTPSISANGSTNGIVWALQNGSVAVLHAYDAGDLTNELYNSNQAPNSRDQFGAGNKFTPPTIANGKVYAATSSGGVAVFGLLNSTPTPTPTATPTSTPTPTATPTPAATATPTATPTPTPSPTATSTPTATPTPTPTPGSTIQVTVQTSPARLDVVIDGITFTSTRTFSWTPGSNHTIGASSPQSRATGVQYVWNTWNDAGAMSHNIAPTSDVTYTASFTTQYYLTMNAGTGGTVSPGSGWKNSGVTGSISAKSTNGYSFGGWTGSGTGSYTGPNNAASITVNAVGSSRVDLQACKLEYSIVSPK